MSTEPTPKENCLTEDNQSPVCVVDGNLYVSMAEWERLCCIESTNPLVSVLGDAKSVLESGHSVRLTGPKGIYISADRRSEIQRLIDDANTRRASLELAPVILMGNPSNS